MDKRDARPGTRPNPYGLPADMARAFPATPPGPLPSAASLVDGAPEPPEASLQQVQQKLAEDENAWFGRHLLAALVLAGQPVTEETLPAYGPRLSMRRYPAGAVIVALDAGDKTLHGPGVFGTVLFGLGEPVVSLFDGLKITRPILSAQQALAYEVGVHLKAHPLYSTDKEPTASDEPDWQQAAELQRLAGRFEKPPLW
jgi:hypothetical protein